MTTPFFQKMHPDDAFYFLTTDVPPTEAPYSIAFLPYQAAPHGESTLTLLQTWTTIPGIYLFLKVEPEVLVQVDFEPAMRQFLRDPAFVDVRFLWIENPNAPLNTWRFNHLVVEPTEEHHTSKVRWPTHFDVRNYTFSIAGGTSIALNALEQPTGFILRRHRPDGFVWVSGYGAHRLSSVGEQVALSMQGQFAGCLQFDFEVNKQGTPPESFGYPDLAHLDIGFRLFMRDPDFPTTGDRFDLSSHRYPLIDEASENPLGYDYYPDTIAFKASLDLLYPLDPDRTQLIFQPLTGRFEPTGIPSAYRTNLGYSVHLFPVPGESCLQFASRPTTLGDEGRDQEPLYLVPAGSYGLQIPRYASSGDVVDLIPEANVICGVSGVEYIKVTSEPPAIPHFVPGQPAFAPSYVSIAALLRDLASLLESFSARPLPPDTTDLDMKIEDQEEGEAEEALGIDDVERLALLDIVQKDYFPPGFQLTDAQLETFKGLEIVEDLIQWFRDTLQTAVFDGNRSGGTLAADATTSWAYVRSTNSAVYYAQPESAVLFAAEASNLQFLDFLEVPAVGLPDILTSAQRRTLQNTTGVESLAFPMLPYGNVDRRALADIRQLEISQISHHRRDRIQRISEATEHATSLNASQEGPRIGTTPQGLIATFSPDFKTIERLQLAVDTKPQLIPPVETERQSIAFVNIQHGDPLKAALQSNQLFMVISDPDAVSSYFSTAILSPIADATNAMDIQKWIFELGTDHWDKKGTVLIFKFHDKPLLELAEAPDLWSLAEDFNRNPTEVRRTSRTLVRLLRQAVEIGQSADPKQRRKYEVLARAATQANWTGILAFNVDVPLGNLPDDLKALAAGMDADQFFSQYVGVEVTQVESTALEPQSSLFGLIDYSNPQIPLADASGYNFHVPSLTVVFENAQVTDFAAELMLIMDQLFDEATTLVGSPDGRNILRLQGVAEEHNGKVTYAFGFSGANHFELSGKVIQEVEIVKAQFVTDPLPNPKPDRLPVKGRFFFWGRLRFVYQSAFDVLSFGPPPGVEIAAAPAPGEDPPPPDYLSMSNLQIAMSFTLNQPDNVVENRFFEFNPNQLAFDVLRSGWRAQSLFEKFPLKVSGLRYVRDDPQALQKSGFMPVRAPGKSAELGERWYGLTFELNLGSVGALAGSAGLVVSILAAWNPEEEGVFVGLKLPGSSGGKREITIQGLLKIAFKSIQFVVYPLNSNESFTDLPADVEREVGYLLKIKNVTLKFFVLSFPPSGQTEFILFGDPRDEVDREDKLLGWYAAYAR